MPALYDQAGALVASGFTVLRESRLTQRRTDVVHDLALGGLPYVVRKDPAGLSGNLEFLCPSAEMADAIYAAHLSGPVRLDNWQRQNLVKDSRMATATWSQAGSTGTFTHATTGGPNGHGYFEYAMTTDTTSSPMTVLVGEVGTAGAPVTPGEPIVVSAYWWQSINQNVQRFAVAWYDASGAILGPISSGEDEITPSDPPAVWYREHEVFTPPPGAAFAQLRLSWSGAYVPQTLRVADALVEYGSELRDYFDGNTPDTDSIIYTGADPTAVSAQYVRPALDLTYLPIGGVALPVRESLNYWRVSVPSVQEVAA